MSPILRLTTTRSPAAAAALALGLVATLVHGSVVAVGVVEAPSNGPPAWVVAGVRITHAASVATVGGGSYELIEDPAGPLEDPVTGRRYRESFTVGAATEGGGGSGEALWEATVAAADGEHVVLSRLIFVNDPLTGTMSIGSSSAERVAADRVNGLWIRPDLLTTLRTGDMGNVLVLRGELSVGGTSYQTVSLVDPTPGAYSFFAYDSVTGVQVLSALRTSTPTGGAVQMSLTELRGVRQLTIPGIGGAVPEWVVRKPELAYAGTQEFVNPMDPSSAPMSFPVSSVTTFGEIGATWAMFATNLSVQMITSTTSTSSGVTGGIGPYWWDPSALAGLSVGQVLDSDPWTGQTLTVTETGAGPAGPAVAISGSMPGIANEVVYDVGTGVMLAEAVATASSGLTTRIQLQQLP